MAIISSRPSVALVKTRWRKKGAPRTLTDCASVIGANIWKIALEIFRHMEKEEFRFGSDQLVTAVMAEFIAFMVQLVDRSLHGRLSDADRATLINETARHLAVTIENNQRDLLGPGDYRKPFIDLLNARFEDYAGFEYRNGEPGFPCVRFFATNVSDAMAGSGNRWVIEQIMDIEAPEMVRLMRKLVDQAMPVGTS